MAGTSLTLHTSVVASLARLERLARLRRTLVLAVRALTLWLVVALTARLLRHLHLLGASAESYLLVTLGLAFVAAIGVHALRKTELVELAKQIDRDAELDDLLKTAIERAAPEYRQGKQQQDSLWDSLIGSRATQACEDLDSDRVFARPSPGSLGLLVAFAALLLALVGFAPQPTEPAVELVDLPPIPGTNPFAAGQSPLGRELTPEERERLEALEEAERREREAGGGPSDAKQREGEAGDPMETSEGQSTDQKPTLEGGDGETQDLEPLSESSDSQELLDEIRRDLKEALERQQGEVGEEEGPGGEGEQNEGQQKMGAESQEGQEGESEQADSSTFAEGQEGDQLSKSDQQKSGSESTNLGEGAQLSGDQPTPAESQPQFDGPAMGDATGPQAGLAQVLSEEMIPQTLAAELALETALLEAEPQSIEMAPLEPNEMASPAQEAKMRYQRVRQRTEFANETTVTETRLPLPYHSMLKKLFPPDPPDPDDPAPKDESPPPASGPDNNR